MPLHKLPGRWEEMALNVKGKWKTPGLQKNFKPGRKKLLVVFNLGRILSDGITTNIKLRPIIKLTKFPKNNK